MLLRYSDDNIRLIPVRKIGDSTFEPLFFINLEVHNREYLVQLLDTLYQGIGLVYNGGFLPGYVVADRHVTYISSPATENKTNWPTWVVIVPDDNDLGSRIIVQGWKGLGDRLYLDIDLQGACNTSERVSTLKDFRFEEVDEEPVPAPGLNGPV